MLHQATATFTLLAMLLHAGLGCGWHHAHAVEGGQVSCAAIGSACCGHQHCRNPERAAGNCTLHAHETPRDGGNHRSAESVCCSADSSLEGLTGSVCADENRDPAPAHRCFESECRYLPTTPIQAPAHDDVAAWHSAIDAVIDLAAHLHSGAAVAFTRTPALTVLPYLPRSEVTRVWLI